MHRCQFYLLNLSLILCLIIGFYHQTNSIPIEDVNEDSSSTTSATKPNENKPVQAALPPYFYMGLGPLWMPFGELSVRNQI